MRSIRMAASFALSGLALAGCVSIGTYDTKGMGKSWGGFKPQGDYVLVGDVFLMRPGGNKLIDHRTGRNLMEDRTSDGEALVPASSAGRAGGRYLSPQTIRGYEEHPSESAKKEGIAFTTVLDVVGIVRAGTRIRTTRIENQLGFSLWHGGFYHSKTVCALIKTGPFNGHEVDIEDLGSFPPRWPSHSTTRCPDPRLLRLVAE